MTGTPVDAYLERLDEPSRATLAQLRYMIRERVPRRRSAWRTAHRHPSSTGRPLRASPHTGTTSATRPTAGRFSPNSRATSPTTRRRRERSRSTSTVRSLAGSFESSCRPGSARSQVPARWPLDRPVVAVVVSSSSGGRRPSWSPATRPEHDRRQPRRCAGGAPVQSRGVATARRSSPI